MVGLQVKIACGRRHARQLIIVIIIFLFLFVSGLEPRRKAETEEIVKCGEGRMSVGESTTGRDGRRRARVLGNRRVKTRESKRDGGKGSLRRKVGGADGTRSIGGVESGSGAEGSTDMTNIEGISTSGRGESRRSTWERKGMDTMKHLFLLLSLLLIVIPPAARAVVENFDDTPSPYAGHAVSFVKRFIGAAAPGAASTPQKRRPRHPHRTGRPRLLPCLLAPPRRGPPLPPATVFPYKYAVIEH